MISLLFLTQNRKGIVARCFRSLTPTLARPDVEWRILDNGSSDGTAEWLVKFAVHYPGKVAVDLAVYNLGVAGGRARLLDGPLGETVIILDSDVEARAPDWLDRLLAPLARPEVWMAGPGGCWLAPDWLDYEPAPREYVGPVDVVSGFCQAWKREALESGIAMDLAYSPRWHEDADMSLQVGAHGHQVWDSGEVGLFHIFAMTGDDGSSGLKQHYLISKWRGKGLVRAERAEVSA